METISLAPYFSELDRIDPVRWTGQVTMVAECLRKAASGATIEVIADLSREPGDAIFETQCGNLNVSVESQLQEIERGLADGLRKHS